MKDFSLGFKDTIRANQKDEVVHRVQMYLLDLGYLKADFYNGLLDEPTQNALRLFQQRRNIVESGDIDPESAFEIELPRCGMPDFPLRFLNSIDEVALNVGCNFEGGTELTYAFDKDHLPEDGVNLTQIEQEVDVAFQEWKRIVGRIGIRFRQVELSANPKPNFVFGWFRRTHQVGAMDCPRRFDGGGRYVGHAFPREGCAERPELAGLCHFDLAESWSIIASSGAIDLQTCALHEIGHLLGLSHIDNSDAVMYELYPGTERRQLRSDDIHAVEELYHIPHINLEILVHFEDVGDGKFMDNEFTELIEGPRRLKGFQLNLREPIPGLELRYTAIAGNDKPHFVGEGEFVGTRDPARTGRISEFAIELVGSKACEYDVFYMAKIQDLGATALYTNGAFCGDRSQSKPIEAILVRIEPKTVSSTRA